MYIVIQISKEKQHVFVTQPSSMCVAHLATAVWLLCVLAAPAVPVVATAAVAAAVDDQQQYLSHQQPQEV